MNSNDVLRSKYIYGRKFDNARAIVQKFNVLRIDQNNKEFAFVEGSSDETFYKNTAISLLRDQTKYIYPAYNSDKSSDIGKQAVCEAYGMIRRNEELAYELDKCLFIIDRDFDEYKKERVFTVTLGHSMECYFLEKDNIGVLFNHYKIEEKEIDVFWKMLIDFAKNTTEFYALKGTMKHIYDFAQQSNYWINSPYKVKNTYADIFDFTFSQDTVEFRKDKMQEEVGLMKKTLDNNKMFLTYYNQLKSGIEDKPRMRRGHDVFLLLQQYMLQKHNIVISTNLQEIVPIIKNMNVDIDIKQISYDV